MLYTLCDRWLPTYYHDSYPGRYRPLHRVRNKLSSNPISALHYHHCMELGICLYGSGVNYIEDRRYDYKAGDLQVVAPGVPHLSKAGEEATEWVWISISPERLFQDAGFYDVDYISNLTKRCYSGVFHTWEHPEISNLIHKIYQLDESDFEFSKIELLFLVGQLLVECARLEGERSSKLGERLTTRKVLPALDHIREHFSERDEMTEARIAQICGMSQSHLRAVFHKETGIGVKQYIIQTRLAVAAHLLKHSEMSIAEIAFESGFGQISSFNRTFQRVFQKTPGQFRKIARETESERIL